MHTDLGSWLAECLTEGLKLSRGPALPEEPKRAEDGCEELLEEANLARLRGVLAEGMSRMKPVSSREAHDQAARALAGLTVKPEHLAGLRCVRFEREAGDNVFLRFEHLVSLRRTPR